MKKSTKRKTAKKTDAFPCRYGCGQSFGLAMHRGRHEKRAHLAAAAAADAPNGGNDLQQSATPPARSIEASSTGTYLRCALKQLDSRESQIVTRIDELLGLQAKRDAIQSERAVIAYALEHLDALKGAATESPKVAVATRRYEPEPAEDMHMADAPVEEFA